MLATGLLCVVSNHFYGRHPWGGRSQVPMYDSILFPTDGSDTAMSVLDYAVDVAIEHGATMHVLSVVGPDRSEVVASSGVDRVVEAGKRTVAETAERIAERDVAVQTSVERGWPVSSIADAAADADLVVMGTHGRQGVDRTLLGSVTEGVLAETPTPTVVVNPGTDRVVSYPPRRLLVPTDGSAGADRALAEATAIAAATDAQLHLLHVVETDDHSPGRRSHLKATTDEAADRLLERAAAKAADAGVTDVATAVSIGHPHREIRRYVDDEHVDLVALGTRGQTDFDRYALGGVSSKFLRTAPVPVIATRAVGEADGS